MGLKRIVIALNNYLKNGMSFPALTSFWMSRSSFCSNDYVVFPNAQFLQYFLDYLPVGGI